MENKTLTIINPNEITIHEQELISARDKQLPEEIATPAVSEKERDPYELTPYMVEYNQKTSMDYTEGYNPQQLDENYVKHKLFEKENSQMPQEVDFTFDIKYSGIDID